MLALLRAYALRVPPIRWLVALAVSLLGLAKAWPSFFAQHNRALTPFRMLPADDQKKIVRAFYRRVRRRVRNIRNHRRMVRGELRPAARAEYMAALKELATRGEKLTAERRAALVYFTTRMSARDIHRASDAAAAKAAANVGPRHLGGPDAVSEMRRAA